MSSLVEYMADNAPVLIWLSDTQGRRAYFNKVWLDFRGRALDQESGDAWREGIHPDDRARCLATYTEAFERRQEFRMEYRLQRHDGEYSWMLDNGKPIFDSNGVFQGYIGSCVDITEQKDSEQRLAASEEWFRLAAQSALVGAWDWDMGERVTWSETLEKIHGFEPGGFPGTLAAFIERLHPEDREGVTALIAQSIETGGALDFEHRIVLPGGEIRWLHGRGNLLTGADGRPVRMVGIAMDVTERKRVEQELLESQARAVAVLETAVNGIITIDESGTIESLNPAALRIFGYEEDELLGQNVKMLMPPPYHEEHDGYLRRYLATGQKAIIGIGREVEGLRKDGSRFPLDLAVSEVQLGEKRIFTGVVNDISARRRAEEGLALLARAGVLLNESLDYDVTLRNLSRALVPDWADWCTVHLLEAGEVRQVSLAHRDPEMVRWVEELQRRFPPDPNAPTGVHAVIRRRESELVPELTAELLERIVPDEERRNIVKQLRLKSYVCVPLPSREGVIGALTLVSAESGRIYDERDVALFEQLAARAGLAIENARLYAASQLAREELERSNRAKDEFLGIVSHELRTPITTIFGGARLISARKGLINEEARDELLAGIEEESEKMVRLVENLLLLARLELGHEVETQPLEVKGVLDKAIAALRPDRSGRKVATSFEHGALTVRAEATYLEQILVNLLTNADKYSPSNEAIEIEVRKTNGAAKFRVMDRGPGVAPEELALIFGSFYRASRTSQLPGKGLGLSICKRLVEAQGGEIVARLRRGGGLEIEFTLPLAQ